MALLTYDGRPDGQTFNSNDRNELTAATRAGGTPAWTRGYEYDPIGNRQWQDMNAVRTTYTSNELNQYTHLYRYWTPESALFPNWDDDGNLSRYEAAGDMNCDGYVNSFDIDPFVRCLTGGGCPPCP